MIGKLLGGKRKLLLLPLVLLLAGGGAYKFVLAKPEKKEPKHKVEGQVYILPKEFVLNLADGRFAKVNVALVLPHDEPIVAEAGGHGAAAKPPEGFGTLPQEAVVRDLVTGTLTDASADQLIAREGREALKKRLKKNIKSSTDVHLEDVLFTDVTVQ